MPRSFRTSRDLVDALFAGDSSQRERLKRTRRLTEVVARFARTGAEPGIDPRGLRLVGFGNHRLTVSVPNATQATGLRYRSRKLLDFINKETGGSFARLVVKVAPAPSVDPQRKPREWRVSGAVIENLESNASGISDPDLSAALMRLASTLANGPGSRH